MIPLVAALCVGFGLFSVITAIRARGDRRVDDLSAVLDGYASETGAAPVLEKEDDLRKALAQSGRMAEDALSSFSIIAKMRATLARSDWTLSAGELINVSLVAGLLGGIVGLLAGAPPLAFILVVIGLLGPYALVVRSVARRRNRFDEQLPDILDLLAASLQSGAGISAALELVVSEAAEPAAAEFGRVLNATRIGESLVDALQTMADRLDSRDLVYTVQAIAVQQRTGGRLAEVLSVVAEFMRSRFELKRELRALTAEGRLSAIILGCLPFALAGIISVTSPGYLKPLYTTAPGAAMLIGAGLLMSIAFVAMARIVRIEV